ncbi:hypothetical protein J8273_1716 [Carpediemonas membranifera]|uniref:Uncharacterized protein n=1 Tax=Carpediemonas membranifera TaxID=201153 RepID=A0A8J6E429_9EUKA|nr:hypothetical protein J8273_1716 [Carpediemonas membranifera]|eukprot:KAG9396698.1 hypothetical protein J8273_1716 [Carpediemonas membranifera]
MANEAELRADIARLEALKRQIIKSELGSIDESLAPPSQVVELTTQAKSSIIEMKASLDRCVDACKDGTNYLMDPDVQSNLLVTNPALASYHDAEKAFFTTIKNTLDPENPQTRLDNAIPGTETHDQPTSASPSMQAESRRLCVALEHELWRHASATVSALGRNAVAEGQSCHPDATPATLDAKLGRIRQLCGALARTITAEPVDRDTMVRTEARLLSQVDTADTAVRHLSRQQGRLKAMVGVIETEHERVQAIRGLVRAVSLDLVHLHDSTQYRAGAMAQAGQQQRLAHTDGQPEMEHMTQIDSTHHFRDLIEVSSETASNVALGQLKDSVVKLEAMVDRLGKSGDALVDRWSSRRKHLALSRRVMPPDVQLGTAFEQFVADPAGFSQRVDAFMPFRSATKVEAYLNASAARFRISTRKIALTMADALMSATLLVYDKWSVKLGMFSPLELLPVELSA